MARKGDRRERGGRKKGLRVRERRASHTLYMDLPAVQLLIPEYVVEKRDIES